MPLTIGPTISKKRKRKTITGPAAIPQGISYPHPNIPDYLQLAANNPGYLAELGQYQSGLQNLLATGSAGIQSALTQLGLVPQGVTATPGTLTEGIDFGALSQQAAANPFSAAAQIEKARREGTASSINRLNPGLGASGEVGYIQRTQQEEANKAQYDAVQKFLDYLAGAQAGYQQLRGEAPDPGEYVSEEITLNPPTQPAPITTPSPTYGSSLTRPSWVNPAQWLKMSRKQRLQTLQAGVHGTR